MFLADDLAEAPGPHAVGQRRGRLDGGIGCRWVEQIHAPSIPGAILSLLGLDQRA
jgi:hypothetical protein